MDNLLTPTKQAVMYANIVEQLAIRCKDLKDYLSDAILQELLNMDLAGDSKTLLSFVNGNFDGSPPQIQAFTQSYHEVQHLQTILQDNALAAQEKVIHFRAYFNSTKDSFLSAEDNAIEAFIEGVRSQLANVFIFNKKESFFAPSLKVKEELNLNNLFKVF